MTDSPPTTHPDPWVAGLLAGLSPDPHAEPWTGRLPTPAELERFEIHDDLARMEDEAAFARGEPGTGRDISGEAAPRLVVRPSDAQPDPLAAMRTDLPVIRVGGRYLGAEFAPPRAVDPYADALPLPKGVKSPALVSGRAWRRRILPTEGWSCMGVRLADGVEGCGYCACGMEHGQRFAVLAHHSNDLTMSCCFDCGDRLCGRPVADRNENETPIPFALSPLRATLQDPSLWEGDLDTDRMVLELCDGFEVRLAKRQQGIELRILFPDSGGVATVVGTYTCHTGAMAAALYEIEHWQSR